VKRVPLTDTAVALEWCTVMEAYGYERRLLAGVRYARSFTGERMDYGELRAIVEVARWAPSIENIQPWEVIIVDDPIEIRKLAGLHPLGYAYARAGALFFIVTDPTQSLHHVIDGGSFTAYLAVAASMRGYSVMIIPLNDDPAFKSELEIPPQKHLLSLVAVGREASSAVSVPARKPLEFIIHKNKYGLPG